MAGNERLDVDQGKGVRRGKEDLAKNILVRIPPLLVGSNQMLT